MRNWINLIEASVPSKLGPTSPTRISIQGAPKGGMSFHEAKSYLDMFPDGVLHHDMFEREAIVGVTEFGNYFFFNDSEWIRKKGIAPLNEWDWKKDIEELVDDESYDILQGWWYEPAQDLIDQTNFPQDLWNDIRGERISFSKNEPPIQLD